MTPVLAAASNPIGPSVVPQSLLDWKAARIAIYVEAMRVKYPDWTLSEVERGRAASTVMDSLLFAGGLSVPSVPKNAFAVLYGEYGEAQLGTDFELTESKLLPFAMEVVRR